MRFTIKKIIFIFSFLFIFSIGNRQVYGSPNITRLSGNDRYETSVSICKNNWDISDTAVIVSGEGFSDALCAAPLAKKYNAPILLSRKDTIPSVVLEEIKRLQVKEVFLVGGQGVLTKNVEYLLKQLGMNIKRVYGQNRYETSIEIAKIIGINNGVVIASGENFPDALSISPIAAYKQMPLILTTKEYFPEKVYKFLLENKSDKYYVIGGQAVIGNYAITSLNNVERLSGNNRYDTNLNVINKFFNDINLENIYLATGNGFPDALAGAPLASRNSSVIILTYNYGTAARSLIQNNLEKIINVNILGGNFAVSNYTINKIIYGRSTSKLVMGYGTYYYSGDNSSYNSLVNNGYLVDEISAAAYTTDGSGNITGITPINQLTYASNNGIGTLAMIGNNFSSTVASNLLQSAANRQKLINNILTLIKNNNYSGVNIDLEAIKYYDRNYFTTFMRELYTALNPKGLKVTVAVPAKTKDITTDGWNGAYDYKEIAKYSDLIVIMTYDEHYLGGEAGPIASINWVKNVINYAVTAIPREKILVGVAAYAYDWSKSGNKSYGVDGAYNVASKYGAEIKWDNVSQSPYFTYKDSSNIVHTVWFENENSLKYKLDLVNSNNLCGIAIWRLGLENKEYWTSIKNKF